MAARLVGGVILSSFFSVLVDRIISSKFINSKTEKMDKQLLERLKTLLYTVNGVLDDAEDRDITYKHWLDDLKDAAYEADDLLDIIAYEVTAADVEAEQRSSGSWTKDLLSLPLKMVSLKDDSQGEIFFRDVCKRMEEIVKRLELLVQQIDLLDLKQRTRKVATLEREPTTSVVNESDIFGRDGDKETVLNLLQKDDTDSNSIGVIPIVGMGGIGKTTLAQLIYNDSRVQELFECRAWVWVSDNYDAFRIKSEVLMQVGVYGRCDVATPEQIDVELRKSLKGKKFLLVLDDMWNDSHTDWDNLLKTLESGALGSKIVVTTRNRMVASVTVGTIPTFYELRELDDYPCWLLFVRHAFNGTILNDQRLETIGKMIVMKCKGLPLAAKMLGCLLRHKRGVTEWVDILNSTIWDLLDGSNLPALRLSYQHLPSHLKQCFAYLAIFPKGYEIKKEEIIHLWMAEGFLVQPNGDRMMEELGEKYLHDLVSRSFLQESRDGLIMHDLINDLAQHVCGEFLVRMEENSCIISTRCRYLSFMASKEYNSGALEYIFTAHHLRTLKYEFYEEQGDQLTSELLYRISCLQRLRVLSLCGYHNVLMKLPNSIVNLKQLRYLNLTGMMVERLPETLCTLYNLQTLILYGCDLVELPNNMESLINLRCLDIRRTMKLQEMPPRMGNLKDLRSLSKFIVGKQHGCDINELGKLQHLHGEFSILNLQNVLEASKDILKNKKYLEDLELMWLGETENSMHDRSVLMRLEPYASIKRLSIYGYGGTRFADWVGDSSYTSMVSLKLQGCKYCCSLPPLGQLPFLEYLSISEFDAILEFGVEFYGSTKTPFISLETLEIKDMSQWQEWIICEGNNSDRCESFLQLERLTLWNCPKLAFIKTCEPTHKIFKSLNMCDVQFCPNLRTSNL